MIAADLGRAALIASIPVASALHALVMPQLYVVGFLSGSLAVIFDLSWNTLFVAVTERERYVEAMALLNGSRSLASVGGPTIGGLLVQVFGAPLAMLATPCRSSGRSSSCAGSARPSRRSSTRRARPANAAGGLSFVLRDPIMRPTLLSVATINLFTFASTALFILYATTILGVSPGALGLALGTGAVGAVIGALVASRIGRRIGLGPAYALGCLIFPVSLLLIPLAGPGMPMPLILALLFGSEFGAGLGVMILDINVGAILYARTPDRIRGRAARSGSSTTASGRSGRCWAACSARAPPEVPDSVRSRSATTSWRSGRVCSSSARPSSALPGVAASRLGVGSVPGPMAMRRGRHSQRKVRAASPTDATAQPPRISSGPSAFPSTDPSATRNASARAAAGRTAATAASGPGRSVTGRMIPPSSRNAMNRPFARASVASARSAPASSKPEPGEGERAEQERRHEEERRRAGSRTPAEHRDGDRDEQDDLPDLDHEDRAHLGDQQAAARQRRAAEPLEDPVVALVGGRDPEVDEARRDDRQRERSRQQEVDRSTGAGRQDADRGEEEQDDDRDDERDQDVLAAAGGQPELHRGLGERRRGRRCRPAHASTPARPPTSSR